MGTQWEYKTVQLKPTTNTANGMVVDQLNEYGKDGWEAWAIHLNNWSGHTVRLKRCVPSPQPQREER